MTGKALVPVVDEGSGRRHAVLLEQRHDLSGEDEVERFEQMVRRRGYYPFRTTPDEVRELDADEAKATELFHRLMLERVEEWIVVPLSPAPGLCGVCLPRSRGRSPPCAVGVRRCCPVCSAETGPGTVENAPDNLN